MNSILEKNIKLLSEKQDTIFGEVLNNYNGQSENCAVIKNLSNEDIVGYIKDEKEIYLNSRYSAEYETELWVSDRVDEVNRPYFIYGFSNGMAVNKFKQKVSDKSVLIVYEPSFDIFYNVISNIDLTDILENSRIILYVKGINDNYLKSSLEYVVGFESIQKARYIILRQYDLLFGEEYEQYIDILRQAVNVIVADAVYFSQNSKKLQNVIAQNMREFRDFRTVNQYVDKFGYDSIAILVGAGPSLSKNVELLKQVKGKAFIFATDSAVKKMAKYDIKPDAFMSIDTDKGGIEYNEILINTPLVMDVNARPELLERHKSVKIISAKNALLISQIYQMMDIPLNSAESGGSVSCSAFSVLKLWGFKKIVLIGQDFAYTDGMVHAEGIFDINNAQERKKEVCYVEGNNGNLIETGFDYEVYLRWFENAIAKWSNGEVINATEGGARVKGATVMTLQEVINKYISSKEITDYEELIRSMSPVLDDANYEKAKEIINDKRQMIDELLQKIDDGIATQNKLKKALKKNNSNMVIVSLQAKMKAITTYIDNYPDLEILYFYKGELVDSMNTETDETDTVRIIAKSIEWLTAMKQAAEEYKKDMEIIISSL